MLKMEKMIVNAIVKDGGLFIPNVELLGLHSGEELMVQFEIIEPLKFQDEQNRIAVGQDALEIFRQNGVVGCLHSGENLSETNDFFSDKETY